MTFEEFMGEALSIDPLCYISEDSQGYLRIETNYRSVGDEGVPLVYDERDF